MAFHFRFGGRSGRKRKLVVANDMMVVRTMRRGPLARTPLGLAARRVLWRFNTIARFVDAGVEVLQTTAASRKSASRDEARSLLKEEGEVQFAGRVLRLSGSAAPVVYTENLFIKFADRVSERALASVLKQHGLKLKRVLGVAPNACFVGPREDGQLGQEVFELAMSLLDLDTVELCHPEMVGPLGERVAAPEQWHLHNAVIAGVPVESHAHVAQAWELTRGEGTTIAVIDDGFDLDHEEFRGAGKIVAPWDATRRIEDARPQFQSERHGTACAGIACANGNHGASGVAPAARLLPIRLRSGVGSVDEAEAIRWAVDHGADVISCSWGPPDGDWTNPDDPNHNEVVEIPDHTRLALEYAVSRGRGGKGCVIAWAAGNGAEAVDNDGYASAPLVMAVGASDDRNLVAPYSDRGKALWCAFPSDHKLPSFTPGIWTTDRGAGAGYNPGRTRLGDSQGNYTNGFGGTSAACPGAAGVAALVLARNPSLDWESVRRVLAETSDRIDEPAGGYVNGRSPLYGFGRLNARRAVERALPERLSTTVVHRTVQDVRIRDRRTAMLSVEVPEQGVIDDLRVDLDIEHSHRGDLVVMLLAPEGFGLDPIVLHNREGSFRNDIKREYDRLSTPAIGELPGRDAGGIWRLEVQDRARGDQGWLRAFGLQIVLRG